MINYLDVQNAYTSLYSALSKYFWGYDVIYALSALEIESFKTMVSTAELRKRLDELKKAVKYSQVDDEEISREFEAFYKLLEESKHTYAKLIYPKEVTVLENI